MIDNFTPHLLRDNRRASHEYIKKGAGFTLPFSKISKKDAKIAGGKGASLGEMTQNGFLVPPGFVVLASVFERFLAETDVNVEIKAMWNRINIEDIESVEENSRIIRTFILNEKMPKDIGQEILKEFKKLKAKFVAVRSSATAEDSKIDSWAGELESYLNTTEKTLSENVKKCWASLYTPRALFYRVERGLHRKQVSVAVVVQKMIQSEVSGICFTVHPVTKDKNQMVIEAGWGLGEAVVGGKITPDTYIVEKPQISSTKSQANSKSQILNSKQFQILDINISEQTMMIIRDLSKGGVKETNVPKAKQEKQKLDNKKILELAKICAKIEEHYKSPQDIEWALEKGKLYITQSRPITTL